MYQNIRIEYKETKKLHFMDKYITPHSHPPIQSISPCLFSHGTARLAVIRFLLLASEARSGTQAGVCDSVCDEHCRTLVG